MSCYNITLLSQIIQQSTTQTLNSANLEISENELNTLNNLITNYYSLQLLTQPNNIINLHSTLKGLIPFSLIDTIRPFTNTKQIATQITIKLLLKTNLQIHEQIWKPYCTQFTQWKRANNIQIPYSQTSKPRRNRTTNPEIYHSTPTYSCICGLADQLHTNNQCPPQGLAVRKIAGWEAYWVKFGYS